MIEYEQDKTHSHSAYWKELIRQSRQELEAESNQTVKGADDAADRTDS